MPSTRFLPNLLLICGVVLLAGCAATQNKAPVEDRQPVRQSARSPLPAPIASSAPVAATADGVKPLPGAENVGKPGYYSVRPGDTMIRIGLEQGQNWRDIVRWNGIENPNLIEVGQVLRVVPPQADASALASQAVAAPKVEAKPLEAKPVAAAAAAASAPSVAASAPTAVVAPLPAKDGDDEPAWAWPAAGSVLAGFEEGKQKGLAIAGKAGDPVLAAADGRVVYAGSGLRGYGNLVIVKHNNTYLTAYAHNQSLLVKEDQAVRRGQKIAEMGSTDAERVQLHFEIRRQGKPVDPARLLPAR
ncbi:MAG: peptidoglycan DD-metalloendopeptidase family protein [Pseudomonadota bacterium]